MVRPLPVLLGLLVVATGVALGLQILTSRPDAAGTGAGTAVAGSALAGGAAPAAPANGDAGTGSAARPQGHVYTAILEEPTDCNPFTTSSAVVRRYVLGFTHEALLDHDPRSGALRGALAQDWQTGSDGRSMTVTLREGVRFADGTPLTAEDVLFTWEVARGRDVVLGSIGEAMEMVAGVEVLPGAPARLRIRFANEHFAAPEVVGTGWIVVHRRWYLDRLAELAAREGGAAPGPQDEGFGTLLARVRHSPGPGTGPYRFDAGGDRPSLRPGKDLTMFRNEHHWRRAAAPGCWNFEAVRILFVKDGAAGFTALVERAIDWYQAQDLDAVLERRPDLAEDYRKVAYEPVPPIVYAVQWNTRRPHLRDPRVRRALGMLFDRARICESLLDGNARPAAAFARPGSPGHPADLLPEAFAPGEAAERLREAGFDPAEGRPLQVDLMTVAEVPIYRQMAEVAADAARRIGVELRVHDLFYKELLERRAGSGWDGVLLGVIVDRHDDPYYLFHSEGGNNAMGWSHARADELLEKARTERDPAARGALWSEFHGIVAEEQPMTLIAIPKLEMLYNRHIRDAVPGPLGLWPERFWVPPEHQRAL